VGHTLPGVSCRGGGRKKGSAVQDSPAASGKRKYQTFVSTSAWRVVRQLEFDRRHTLIRIIALGLLALTALLLPTILPLNQHPGTATAVGIALAAEITAYVLNRRGYVTPAGFVLLGGIALACAWEIFSRAIVNPAVDITDLRLYSLLLLPILLSTVLTGRRGPIVFTSFAVLFTIFTLLVLPQSPPLRAYWNGHWAYESGGAYDVVALPVAFAVLTGIVAWLGADSIRRMLLMAARTDDLALAYQHIVQQTEELEAQRRRMRKAVLQIQNVHSAIARGQLDARATVDEAELLPLATSLNLLIERLTRMKVEDSARLRMEATAQRTVVALRRMWAGEPYVSPDYTGTPLDEVLLELSKLRGGNAINPAASQPRLQRLTSPPWVPER
jgi:hypothetical protein